MKPEDLNEEETEDENLKEAEYSKKAEYSKPQSVQEAVSSCRTARGQEMKEGYYNYIIMPNGQKKIYIPDTRKAFIGSVEALMGILSPEIKRSKTTQEKLLEFEKEKVKLFDKYSVQRAINLGMSIQLSEEKYIPEVGEEYPVKVLVSDRFSSDRRIQIVDKKGVWDYNVRKYWDEMVKVYDKQFSELNDLVDSIEYFKSKTGF